MTVERRATYRHGNLREALVEAGLELARQGGPDAVVLREVTRRVGVVPNAAYRHFRDRAALQDAVAERALEILAGAMANEQASVQLLDAGEAATARMLAVGSAYLEFARDEPGWFRTATTVRERLAERQGEHPANPFWLLNDALDGMVETGAMAADRRELAAVAAWSAVHGLAMLVLDGPLRTLTAEQRRAAARRVLSMVEHGL